MMWTLVNADGFQPIHDVTIGLILSTAERQLHVASVPVQC